MVTEEWTVQEDKTSLYTIRYYRNPSGLFVFAYVGALRVRENDRWSTEVYDKAEYRRYQQLCKSGQVTHRELEPDRLPMGDREALMPIVNDQNLMQGHCPRSNIHRPPFPIHQAVSAFLIGMDGRVYLQKRSLEVPGFPNRLDVVGGHLKKFGQYLETIESEVRGETRLRVSRKRFQRILDGDNDFFKVRTSDNNENKAVFIVRLEPAEEDRLAETNNQLGYIWDDVAETAVRELGLETGDDRPIEVLRKLVHKDAERKITEVGQVLRDEFQKRLDDCAHDPAQTELLKMAREVEMYVPMFFSEALREYERDPDRFADGFYALIDPSKNSASEASRYPDVFRRQIEEM